MGSFIIDFYSTKDAQNGECSFFQATKAREMLEWGGGGETKQTHTWPEKNGILSQRPQMFWKAFAFYNPIL